MILLEVYRWPRFSGKGLEAAIPTPLELVIEDSLTYLEVSPRFFHLGRENLLWKMISL